MKYFVTEEEREKSGSTCFIEFQRGAYDGRCWKEDSLCISDDLFHELRLNRLFSRVLPQFDYFGITNVSLEGFQKIKQAAEVIGSETYECIQELDDYFKDDYNVDVLFTVCGM